ncbi:hypothetical protein RN001_012132 [Aquatica leii]|uniref:Uncharacterized protein n=1 Tax=Aquatica leii TaxID=1421715 RepID=A0AAN7NY48_9COLE|nr:hypothetical protein RN001_012132 [Aquatica leii]
MAAPADALYNACANMSRDQLLSAIEGLSKMFRQKFDDAQNEVAIPTPKTVASHNEPMDASTSTEARKRSKPEDENYRPPKRTVKIDQNATATTNITTLNKFATLTEDPDVPTTAENQTTDHENTKPSSKKRSTHRSTTDNFNDLMVRSSSKVGSSGMDEVSDALTGSGRAAACGVSGMDFLTAQAKEKVGWGPVQLLHLGGSELVQAWEGCFPRTSDRSSHALDSPPRGDPPWCRLSNTLGPVVEC